MTLTGISVAGTGFESASGGAVAFDPDANVFTSAPLRLTEYGMTLGPLELLVYEDTQVDLARAELMPGRTDSLFREPDDEVSPLSAGLFAAGLGTTSIAEQRTTDDDPPDESSLSRRDVLRAATSATGLAALGTAAAQEEPFPVFELDIQRNPGGFRLRIDELVEAVLPANQTYSVVANGTEIDTFLGDGRDGVTIGRGLTGRVSIHTEPDTTLYENIRALVDDSVLEYEFNFQTPAAGYEPATELEITAHPVVVAALQDAGANESTAALEDTQIPHRAEDGDADVGWYAVTDPDNGPPQVTYHVGTQAPEASVFTVRMRVSRVDELLADANHRVEALT
jgi:hypothetical protein